MIAKQAKTLAEDSLYATIMGQIERASRDGRMSAYLYPRLINNKNNEKKYEPIYDLMVHRLKEEGYDAKIEMGGPGFAPILTISWENVSSP
jgi:hypothetical protein